jgi:hypothetical protein
MAEGLGDHGLADPDGVVEDDRFLGLDEAQVGRDRGSAHRDLSCRRSRLLAGAHGLEVGLAYAPRDASSIAPGELALTERLEELDVAEIYRSGLGQPSMVSRIPSSITARSIASS